MRFFAKMLLPALVTSIPLAAQQPTVSDVRKSSTSKWFMEFGGSSSSLSVDELSDGRETGFGFALRGGYGFTPKLAGILDLTTASIGSGGEGYSLGQADLGVRYHFSNASRALVPFVDAAVTVIVAWQDNVILDPDDPALQGDLEISGTGFTLGGGLHYFLNPRFALSAGFKWTSATFDEASFGDFSVSGLSFDANSTRLNFGIAWFPMRPR